MQAGIAGWIGNEFSFVLTKFEETEQLKKKLG